VVKIPVKTAKKEEEKMSEELQKEQSTQEKKTSGLDTEQEVLSHKEENGNDRIEEDAKIEKNDEDLVTTEELSCLKEAEENQQDEEEVQEDELTRLTKDLERKEQEIRDHYDARLRLQAEFDNFKKRRDKEIADFRKYANESLLEDILMVVDDFERAIAAAEQTHKLEDFLEGVELIFNKFLDILKKKGITEIEAVPGQPFNPEIHEAVTQSETDEVEEGMIYQVFQKGYYLHERVLRAPKVVVAKAKS